ncbi:kinase-like domain-containing protein [Podospora didyma]|uniref:Kinase-like domain-containing protein n=1 Tax=Podospora didyma TaxID=330526 RepID=A0AAE0U3G8_9PEZI|nr:kinase-like domain-containing protein [Podospora didyma]
MASPALSSDEGEIVEATPLPRLEHNGEVDRTGRHRGATTRTPDVDVPPKLSGEASRRRSRSPRGSKRFRDDSYDRRDARQFHGRHDDKPRDDRRHGRDIDRPTSRGHLSHNDDRSNYHSGPRDPLSSRVSGYRQDDRRREGYLDNKRPRTRSRSPRGRPDRGNRERGRYGQAEYKYSAQERREHDDFNLKRATPADASYASKPNPEHDRVTVDRKINGLTISEVDASSRQNATQDAEPDADWDPSSAMDQEAAVEAEIQRRRRAREAAYKRGVGAVTPTIQALQAGEKLASAPGSTEGNTPQSNAQSSPALSPARLQDGMSPAALGFAHDQELVKAHDDTNITEEDGPSAADYDPTVDMREDGRRDEVRFGYVGLHGEIRQPPTSAEPAAAVADKVGNTPEGEAEGDDDFDMFAEDFDEMKFAPPPAAKAATTAQDAPQPGAGGGKILDGDDKDGYYKIRPGDVLDGRYQVSTTLGRGMFSGVARARDLTCNVDVAIKIMRKNDALRKGGFTEIAILQKLNAADPEGKKNIIRFERSFEYKGHLCMVFESLSMNLRELLKKFGNNIGISMKATRNYAYQMFIALAHMRRCSIIHADLKPDNILVGENRGVLRICDLGTAIDRSDAATASTEVTPYLVSRFYRAPEIILGMPYDYAVDMWSIGCTLYELYTGKILFTGNSNNQMLKNIQEVRGKLSPKLCRRGQLYSDHFDESGNFISIERETASGKVSGRSFCLFLCHFTPLSLPLPSHCKRPNPGRVLLIRSGGWASSRFCFSPGCWWLEA